MFRNPPWNYIPFLQGMQYKHLCFSNTNLSAIIGRESESFFHYKYIINLLLNSFHYLRTLYSSQLFYFGL